ncbi:alpha/beta hydrolase family protein [Daejeonella lutea]|uniref:Alpha/beta hydrolase family protein n=1 Tax=Daejeonella lutea TaxID=572036 RepID=A0A1T5EU48_9SPHI|nr:prolyl oligopeptidase family serine peptidase [Daejeonella lutea]SKB87388.1 Alpha/beta hydrolase family protein [Daejeonella lutea]
MIINQTFTIPGAEGKPILIDLTYKTGNERAPLVLFVHGFKGFKDWGTHNMVAEYFADHGLRYLKFNFSHNGTTPESPQDFVDLGAFGDNTFTKEFEDLDHVITFVKSGREFPAPMALTLIGHSRGGGTSIIQTAKDDRVDKLITWASIARFNSLWKAEDEDEWRQKGVIYNFNTRTKQYTPLKIDLLHDLEKHAKSYDILAAAGRISKPWLIIHGDEDINVDLAQAKELEERSNKAELFVVTHANHVFGSEHPYTKDDLPLELQLVCEKSIEFINGGGAV